MYLHIEQKIREGDVEKCSSIKCRVRKVHLVDKRALSSFHSRCPVRLPLETNGIFNSLCLSTLVVIYMGVEHLDNPLLYSYNGNSPERQAC